MIPCKDVRVWEPGRAFSSARVPLLTLLRYSLRRAGHARAPSARAMHWSVPCSSAWRTHMPMLQCASLRNLYRMRRLAVPKWLASPERRKRTSRCSMRRGHRHRRQPRQETFLRRCPVRPSQLQPRRFHLCSIPAPIPCVLVAHRHKLRRGSSSLALRTCPSTPASTSSWKVRRCMCLVRCVSMLSAVLRATGPRSRLPQRFSSNLTISCIA